jgi:hypothetical protein
MDYENKLGGIYSQCEMEQKGVIYEGLCRLKCEYTKKKMFIYPLSLTRQTCHRQEGWVKIAEMRHRQGGGVKNKGGTCL